MTRLEREIHDWQEERWSAVHISAFYRKLVEEVGGLGEAIMSGDKNEMLLGAGDVGVVLVGIVSRLGDREGSLTAWMTSAMNKNYRRETKEREASK